MHDHVRACDQLVHGRAVEHVALAILGALPAVSRRVERAPRHADDAADLLGALERAHHRTPDVAGRPGDRDGERFRSIRGHRAERIAKLRKVRVLTVVNQRDAGPGVFADAVHARGAALDTWFRAETDVPPADPAGYDAVMIFGGAMHADHEDGHPWLRDVKAELRELLAREVPVLGVCLGAQLLAEAAGATPRRAREPEIGWHDGGGDRRRRARPAARHRSPPASPRSSGTATSSRSRRGRPRSRAARSACRHSGRAAASASSSTRRSAPPTPEAWIADYRSDEDAVRIGVDPDALRAETRAAIGEWNEVGRAFCDRFLDSVSR